MQVPDFSGEVGRGKWAGGWVGFGFGKQFLGEGWEKSWMIGPRNQEGW